MSASVPYISFTFDDFPGSAFHVGGSILSRCGARGTYYVSFGLLGTEAPTGRICILDDVKDLLVQGHELGCHTFAHSHSWDTIPDVFEKSLIDNKCALSAHLPGRSFKTLAYPVVGPRPETKRRAGTYFHACRGGGQTFNSGFLDLSLLKAYFLEKSRDDVDAVKRIIDRNVQARGWLIFATHDISDTPTRYGCTPRFFEEVVRYAAASGSKILPVAEALDAVLGSKKE